MKADELTLVRAMGRRRRKHVHEWVYGKPTVGGWGVVRCRTCGETEVYA